ncbi:MAG: hypothetical protein ACI9KE_003017 [Polyangiales bacterium]|jgi:hypothetical protein
MYHLDSQRKTQIMNRAFQRSSTLLFVGLLGCGGGQANAREQAFVESTDISNQSGGHVTIGVRVTLDEDETGPHTHLEAIIVNLAGEETTTDLGDYDGIVTQVANGPSEIGHLQFREGSIVHDLVLVETPDHERLQLRLDGVVVQEVSLPAHEVVDPQSPFLLRPPFSD